MNQASAKWCGAASIFLLALNLILKYWNLSTPSLAGDEPFSVYFAQMPVPDILRHLKTGNNPPLFELLLHYWIQWFGIGETAVRIPSLIFSSLTPVVIYHTVVSHFKHRSMAWLSAFIFTFSNYSVLFAHEARVYALFGLLTALSTYFFLCVLNEHSSKKQVVALGLVNALLIYSHYFGIMVVGIQLLLLAATGFQPEKWKHGLLALGITLLGYLPYVPIVIERFSDTVAQGTWLTPPQGLASLDYMMAQFTNSPFTSKLSFILLVSWTIISLANYKNLDRSQAYIFGLFWLPFIGMFLWSYAVPMFHNRYLMHAYIGVCILLGVSGFSEGRFLLLRKLLAVFLLFTMASSFTTHVDNHRHSKEAVQKVKELMTSDTRVAIFPKYRVFGYAYYLDRQRFENYDLEYGYYHVIEGFKEENIYFINQHSEARIDSTDNRHFLFLMTDGGPEDQLVTEFDTTFDLVNKYHFPEIINLYEMRRN